MESSGNIHGTVAALELANAQLLSLADDLTGALEAGAHFAASGITARVSTDCDGALFDGAQVLVIDTETRHVESDLAGQVVERIARRLSAPLVHKKTDSTLRGHIAAEFAGLLRALPRRRLVYVPAYPKLGRTVRDGRLYVDGIPVEETAFARDPLNPVRSSDIASLLEGLAVEIVDGETDADVMSVATRCAGEEPPPLLAGPAALAQALAHCLPFARNAAPPLPRIARALVVNGSLHPASRMQVEYAPPRPGWTIFDSSTITASGLDRADRSGEAVARLLADDPACALVVFGGDTARAIHRALGSHDFTPAGEAAPGVAVARSGGRWWITKSGGFGPPLLLAAIQEKLA